MQSLFYNLERTNQSVVWKVATKYYNFVLGVKQVVHQQLCWWTKAKALLVQFVEHRARRE